MSYRLFFVKYSSEREDGSDKIMETPMIVRIDETQDYRKINIYIEAFLRRVLNEIRIVSIFVIYEIGLKETLSGELLDSTQFLLYFNTNKNLWMLRDYGHQNPKVMNYLIDKHVINGMLIISENNAHKTLNVIKGFTEKDGITLMYTGLINELELKNIFCTEYISTKELSEHEVELDISPEFQVECAHLSLSGKEPYHHYFFILDSSIGIETIIKFCNEARKYKENISIYVQEVNTSFKDNNPLYKVSAHGSDIIYKKVVINDI